MAPPGTGARRTLPTALLRAASTTSKRRPSAQTTTIAACSAESGRRSRRAAISGASCRWGSSIILSRRSLAGLAASPPDAAVAQATKNRQRHYHLGLISAAVGWVVPCAADRRMAAIPCRDDEGPHR
jgi:hypothetical protein